jgi:ligand-binding sensor domain-containing protein
VYMLPVHTKNSKVYAMVISTDGTLWVAGEEGVMYLKDGVLHSVRINNTMFSVRAMQLSADGSLWIATAGEGVLHCRFGPGHQLQLIKQYDETAGFNTRLFLHLLVDKDDNIWAASAKGLSYIGRNGLYAGRVLNFEEEDGFIQPGYASIKLCQADDGAIWAATTMGIVSFNPVQLFLSGSVPKVYITAVSQLRKELLQDNIDTLLAASANQPVKWAYNNSAVGFDYMAIDFANQQSLIYYYKMDGVDSSWITAGKNRTVFYPNLPPGSYRFRVKALNDKGVWSTQEV